MAEIKVADLVAEIKFRDEKFKREMSSLRRTVDKRTDQMVNEFKKVERKGLISFKRLATGAASALGGILAFVAARGLFRGFVKIVNLASDTTESMNKVKEVFGKAAGSVIKFSQTAAVALGATKEEALAMTGEVGNLLVAMGSTEEAAAKMSTDILQLAADLGSFNNVPTTQALNAIRAALIGETEPMRRFGSNVSAARVEALALSRGIKKTTLATNEMMKAQLRLEIIFKDTKKAQGDFARTSNDFANLMKTLTSLFSDAAAELGTALIPKITELAREVKTFVTGTKFEKLVDNLAIGFGVLADKIGGAVKQLFEWITVTGRQTVKERIVELQTMRSELVLLRTALEKGTTSEKEAGFTLAIVTAGVRETSRELKELTRQLTEGKVKFDDFINASGKPILTPKKGTRKIEPESGISRFQEEHDAFIAVPIVPFFDNVSKTALEEEANEIEKFLESQLFLDVGFDKTIDDLDEAADAAERLDKRLKGVAAQLGASIRSGEDFLKVLIRIALQQLALEFTGPVGIAAAFASSLFKQGGGGVVGPSGHIQAATGLSGIVPQGFNKDDFLIGVNSRERVKVETPFQASANDAGQRKLVSAVQALSANVSLIRSEQQDIIAMVSIEGREFQLLVEKSQQHERRFT